MANAFRYVVIGFLLVAGCLMGRAEASVVIGGTRVVYPARSKEVTIKLNNEGAEPALVQVWLDSGDQNATPDTANVPFTIVPPIFRIDPGKGQAVRVMYTGEPLATDKETLFWVNMLEVPPKAASSSDHNLLQFAFRTRIKFFFRPAGLPGDASSAPDKLVWKLVNADGGKGVALQVSNPTPFYVNFAHVGLKIGDKSLVENGGLVAPRAIAIFPIKQLGSFPGNDVQAQFTVINDFGALTTLAKPLAR
jgi:chaperone protein EcpD